MIVYGALIDSGIEVQCVRGEHVWVGSHGLRGGGGGGGYQPGVYVPLKALFLVNLSQGHLLTLASLPSIHTFQRSSPLKLLGQSK